MAQRHITNTLAAVSALVVGLAAASASAHPASFPHSHDAEHPPTREIQAPPRPAPVYVEAPAEEAPEPWRRPVFYLGLGGFGSAIACERGQNFSCDMDGGGGVELFLGWRLGGVLGIDLDWMTSFHDAPTAFDPTMTAALTTVAANLRFYIIPSSRRIEPYVLLGIGGTALSRDSEFLPTLTGPSLSTGAGIDINLTRRLTLGVKGFWRGAWLADRDEFALEPVEKSFLSTVSAGAHLRVNF
jgi:opacity protein-like surface antigen